MNLSKVTCLGLLVVAGIALFLPALAAQGILNTFTIAEIQEEFDLTDEQASRLAILQESHVAQSGNLNKQIRRATTPDARQDLVRQWTELVLESHASLQQILSEQQLEELQSHLDERLREGRNPQQPDYRRILNLTHEQALQFTALLSVYQPGIQELMTELKQADSTRKKRSIGRSLKPLSEEMDLQVKGILDGEQYGQWKAIQAERRAEMRKKLR